MKTKKLHGQTESEIQKSIVNFLLSVGYDGRKGLVFSVPNESMGARWGARMKSQGRLAGAADLQILKPCATVSAGHVTGEEAGLVGWKPETIFVEVKTRTGRQSPSQKEFQRCVEGFGFEYLIWRSLDDCMEWVKEHGK